MVLTIQATERIVVLDGVYCRMWNGTTVNGVKCFVFVHRVAVSDEEDATDFEDELKEQLPPSEGWNLRSLK